MTNKPLLRTFLLLANSSCFLWACCGLAAEADSVEQPPDAETLLKTLDPFYKQHVVADGLLSEPGPVAPPMLPLELHLVQALTDPRQLFPFCRSPIRGCARFPR